MNLHNCWSFGDDVNKTSVRSELWETLLSDTTSAVLDKVREHNVNKYGLKTNYDRNMVDVSRHRPVMRWVTISYIEHC